MTLLVAMLWYAVFFACRIVNVWNSLPAECTTVLGFHFSTLILVNFLIID